VCSLYEPVYRNQGRVHLNRLFAPLNKRATLITRLQTLIDTHKGSQHLGVRSDGKSYDHGIRLRDHSNGHGIQASACRCYWRRRSIADRRRRTSTLQEHTCRWWRRRRRQVYYARRHHHCCHHKQQQRRYVYLYLSMN
jgi:hypothetical protein